MTSDSANKTNQATKAPLSALASVAGAFWATWGLISFALSFILIFPFSMGAYLFKNEWKGQWYFISVSRVWMWTWLRLVGCPVKVSGTQHFKKGQNYVIVYNHNALLDVPLSAPFVPGPNKTIAKASFAKVPIFGLFYQRGSVLVDRDDTKSRLKSIADMRLVLQKGMHMCIYPEGTRNRTTEPLKPFFDGAFRLAIDAGKEVIPCLIEGTDKAMPIHQKFFLRPTRLRMTFLAPISSNHKKTGELKQEVFNSMYTFYTRKRSPLGLSGKDEMSSAAIDY